MCIQCRFLLDKGINPRHRMYVVLKCDQNGKRKINTYFDHLYSITIDRPIFKFIYMRLQKLPPITMQLPVHVKFLAFLICSSREHSRAYGPHVLYTCQNSKINIRYSGT